MKTEPAKKRSQRNLMVTVITAVTIVTWVGFEAYRAYVTTRIKPATKQLLTPLQPDLATEVLEKLGERTGLPRDEIKQTLPLITAPTPTEAPEASPTPVLQPAAAEESTLSASEN